MIERVCRWVKSLFFPYGCVDPIELAKAELEGARRDLLHMQSTFEYASSMCVYREAQIRRLERYVLEEESRK